MLKKITRLGLLTCLMFGFLGAFAQDETKTTKKYKQEYPHYGFWSNWSLGINAEWQYQLTASGYDWNEGFFKYGQKSLAGLGVDLEKELNHVWGFRLRYQSPILTKWINSYFTISDKYKFDWYSFFRYGKGNNTDPSGYNSYLLQPLGFFGIDFKMNIIDALAGYKPNRVFSWYLYAGGGLVHQAKYQLFPDTISFKVPDPNNYQSDLSFFQNAYGGVSASADSTILFYRDDPRVSNYIGSSSEYSKFAVYASAGTGLSFKLCKHLTYFLEGDLKVVSDIPNVAKLYTHHLHFTTTTGFMINFGPTATDLEMIAQRALLTQENFDAMEEQISDLESDLSTCKKAEQRLENRVNELEGQVTQLTALANERPKTTTNNNEEVQRMINQMKADQLTYYAIPFSVLFGNDQWRVPQDQHRKLQAIAKVMEKDTIVTLTLVGFCDYTASDEYNMKLSEKRVKEVKRVLVEQYGVDADRLNIDYKGKNVPFGDEHYSVNRRVSFYRTIE